VRELFEQIVWRNHLFTLAQLSGSLILLIASLVYYFDQQENLINAKADLDAQIYTNDDAEAASYILRDYLDDYRNLQASGHIGEPQRLQWLETLRNLSEQNDIPGVGFTLEGSSLVEANSDPYWHNEIPIRATNMKLTMQLSHEGDLYKILEGLRVSAPGMFNTEQCYLRWLQSFNDDIALTRLRGECDLRWYSLDDVTKEWGQPAS
jgi:hypothetical protein